MNARTGDLFVVVLVADHHIFRREGRDLLCDIPVSYTQLVLGDEIEIPTLDSKPVKVKVPQGTQTNTRFRMKNRGVPAFSHPLTLGDIVATVKVESPIEISDDYRKVLDQLADLEKKHVTPRRTAFSKKI